MGDFSTLNRKAARQTQTHMPPEARVLEIETSSPQNKDNFRPKKRRRLNIQAPHYVGKEELVKVKEEVENDEDDVNIGGNNSDSNHVDYHDGRNDAEVTEDDDVSKNDDGKDEKIFTNSIISISPNGKITHNEYKSLSMQLLKVTVSIIHRFAYKSNNFVRTINRPGGCLKNLVAAFYDEKKFIATGESMESPPEFENGNINDEMEKLIEVPELKGVKIYQRLATLVKLYLESLLARRPKLASNIEIAEALQNVRNLLSKSATGSTNCRRLNSIHKNRNLRLRYVHNLIRMQYAAVLKVVRYIHEKILRRTDFDDFKRTDICFYFADLYRHINRKELKLIEAPNIRRLNRNFEVDKIVSLTCDRAEFNGQRKLGLIELCRSLLKILLEHRPRFMEVHSFKSMKEVFDADFAEIEAFMKANYTA